MNGIHQLPHVVIIGAGPSGCLLALLLADTGGHITVYDSRKDSRTEQHDIGTDQRSINLAISTRGLTALSRVKLDNVFSRSNLAQVIASQGIPMHARCVHHETATSNRKEQEIHPYGRPDQYLLSVSRTTLTHKLQDACEKHPAISIMFQHKCTSVNLAIPSVTVVNEQTNTQYVVSPELIVGADGTFSRVRAAMAREPGFNFSQEYIPCLYKELTFTPINNNMNHDKTPIYTPNALHIWPRQDFMLIALPNWHQSDDDYNANNNNNNNNNNSKSNSTVKTFTATLFMSPERFKEIESENIDMSIEKRVTEFFKNNFPDALPAMPNVIGEFKRNPTAPLVTIRCYPYHHAGHAVLIGDAAHAIVPFYGQGCNAAMEDAVILADTITKYGWEKMAVQKAIAEFSKERKADADTIADLAIDHYYDMSSRSASRYFVLKRRIEIWLNRLFPKSFLPLYSLISFSNMDYHKAVERARKQDTIIGTGIGITAALFTASVATAVVVGTNVNIKGRGLPFKLR